MVPLQNACRDLKNTFLSAVSHELRTPLTSILGFAVTMLDRPEIDDEQRERMQRTIIGEAEHLEDILANLLDLDRLTRGKVTLLPIDVDPAVIEAAVRSVFDLRPGAIVRDLDLKRPIYKRSAAYGHFGRAGFPWEDLSRLDEFKSAVGV